MRTQRRLPHTQTSKGTLALLLALMLAGATLAQEVPPVGLKKTDTSITLTLEEYQKAEWYQSDNSMGSDDFRVRMNCGSKEMRSIQPRNPADFTVQELAEVGYLNICVPVQSAFHADAQGRQNFSLDPPVYMHTDFNLPLHIIFPDLLPGWVGQNDVQFTMYVEETDPITGVTTVTYSTINVNIPSIVYVVDLVDGFGRVRVHTSRPIYSADWTPIANAQTGTHDIEQILDLRSVLIDPRIQTDPTQRWTPYKDPPMMVFVGAILASAEGWAGPFYLSFGSAILVPTTGIEALPPPADLGMWLDATTGQVSLDWALVEGATGYKVVQSPFTRETFTPYSVIPDAHLYGRWYPDDFAASLEAPLYTTPGVPITHTWSDLGTQGAVDTSHGTRTFVVAVGPAQESLGGLPLAGRPSRSIVIGNGAAPVRMPDGEFRLGGPTIQIPPHAPDEHGQESTPVNGMDLITGFGFGTGGGQLRDAAGQGLPWNRLVRWSDTQIEVLAAGEPGESLVRIVDPEGVGTPVLRQAVATSPSFGLSDQSWFEPNVPFLIAAKDGGEVAPEFTLMCDSELGLSLPSAAAVDVAWAEGSWRLTVSYPPQETPCYFCHCYLEAPVEAADGLLMQDPFWRWPAIPVPKSVGSHVAAYIESEGEVWFEGTYAGSLSLAGIDTGQGVSAWRAQFGMDNGPLPVALRAAKSLAWSFGQLGTGVLGATERAAVRSVLEQGGVVALMGQYFLASLMNEPSDFVKEALGLEGIRAVRLGQSVDVPLDSPVQDYVPASVELKEECRQTVAYVPIPGPECDVLMTTATSQGNRPAVVSCKGGKLLISGLRSDCFWDPVMAGWLAALEWQ